MDTLKHTTISHDVLHVSNSLFHNSTKLKGSLQLVKWITFRKHRKQCFEMSLVLNLNTNPNAD